MPHSYKRILSFSLLLSYLCSVAYVLVLLWFLPESDAAKKSGILVLLDPFVQAGMLVVWLPIGLLGSVVVWRLLRHCDLLCVGVALLLSATAIFVSVHAYLPYSIIGGTLVCALICVGTWLLQGRKTGQPSHGADGGNAGS